MPEYSIPLLSQRTHSCCTMRTETGRGRKEDSSSVNDQYEAICVWPDVKDFIFVFFSGQLYASSPLEPSLNITKSLIKHGLLPTSYAVTNKMQNTFRNRFEPANLDWKIMTDHDRVNIPIAQFEVQN